MQESERSELGGACAPDYSNSSLAQAGRDSSNVLLPFHRCLVVVPLCHFLPLSPALQAHGESSNAGEMHKAVVEEPPHQLMNEMRR